MKPGYKTTEFWLTVASNILGLLYASGVITDGGTIGKIIGVAAMILATLGYNVSRGIAKSGQQSGVIMGEPTLTQYLEFLVGYALFLAVILRHRT